VFAIIGEELGFIGLLGILALFAFFVLRGLKATFATKDQFGTLLGIGIVSWIAYQTLINVGGITRSIPLTGVPLPFLSYGGSALIAVMAGAGVLLSLSRYSHGGGERPKARAQRYARRRPAAGRETA
jgi:cell division protein FtsW